MKNFLIIPFVLLIAVVLFINACGRQRVRKGHAKVTTTHTVVLGAQEEKDILAVKSDSTNTYREYRKELITKLSRNITDINNVKANSISPKDSTAIDVLENRNNELILRLDNIKADKNWNINKGTLKNDVDKLSADIKGVATQ